MSLIRRLWERHKNPLSWFLRPVFLGVICYGAWCHSWFWITFGIIDIATGWFWFPKPKKTIAWTEKFIDKELEFLKAPMTLKKTAQMAIGAVVLVLLFIAFWQRNLVWGLVLVEICFIYKLIWSVWLAKTQSWLITISLIIAIVVTAFIALALL